MAKETTPQPQLRPLIEQIQLLSDSPVSKLDIANAMRVTRETVSRWLAKEEAGGQIPGEIIAKLKSKYKNVLEPAKGKMEEGKAVSRLIEHVLFLMAKDEALTPLVKEIVSEARWEEAQQSFQRDGAQRVALFREKGIF